MGNIWTEQDEIFMRRALQLAARGLGRVEPNPMVGAVVVSEGEIIGEGYHKKFGGPHAEVNAFEKTGEASRGATLYVTLEPCNHLGKTPPCTDVVLQAGIRRVVAAAQDPNPKVSGRGFETLQNAGVQVDIGLMEEKARRLNAPYEKWRRTGIPFVTAKWAMTLDGRIASVSKDSKWITSKPARKHAHKIRAQASGILVGIETVLRDDPWLTCRILKGRNPKRIILDSQARIPTNSRLIQTIDEGEIILVTTGQGPTRQIEELEKLGCQVIVVPEVAGRCSLVPLMQELSRRDVHHILVEGGQKVLSSFFKDRLVDRVMVYLGSKILGDGVPPIQGLWTTEMMQSFNLKDIAVHRIGSDVLIEGLVRDFEEGASLEAELSE